MGTNPFRLLLVILRSTYGQSMSSRPREQFGYLPRKSKPSDDSFSRDEIAIMVARLTLDINSPHEFGILCIYNDTLELSEDIFLLYSFAFNLPIHQMLEDTLILYFCV